MRRAGRVLLSAERTLVQSSVSCSYVTSPLFDYRRLRERSKWINPVDETDADFRTVPVHHIGNNDEVNWAFNEYQVTPSANTNVYRNLHLRGLLMLANGQRGKNNVLTRKANEEEHQIFYVNPNDASPNAVPPATWTNVSRLVKEALSGQNQESLFMNDGYLGSLNASNLPIRVLTNSGFVSLFLHHATFPVKASVSANEFYHSATVWVVDSSLSPFPYEQTGINSKNFTLVDKQKNRVIIVGDSISTTALEDSLVAFARDYFNEKLSLLLPCDTIIDKNGNTGFLFSGKSVDSKLFDIYSSKSTIWNYFGVSRLWNSYQSTTTLPTATRGDIIEQFGNSTKFIHSTSKPYSGAVSHPNSVFFLNDNPSAPGISQITENEQIKNLVQSSNPGLALVADQFLTNVEEDKIKCYLVNATGNQVESLIAKTLTEA